MRIHNAWRYHINNKGEFVILNGIADTDVGEFYPYASWPTREMRINPEEGDSSSESIYNHHPTFNRNGSVWYRERNDEAAKKAIIYYQKERIKEYEALIENLKSKIKSIENDENIVERIVEI
ncbi:MAG: hypothetical protein J6Y02_11280 [Pseudobutyrivibrio sp.]|nr:hypothetical protein [Pseudobutyrivibrio sp.]